MSAQATGRPSLPPGHVVGVPRKCVALPGAKAGLRNALTPLATGCFALVAGPYLDVRSPLLALASFATFLGLGAPVA